MHLVKIKSICYTCIISIILFISIVTAGTVKTINIERSFAKWKAGGCNCVSSVSNFWYVFSNEMQPEVRRKVRYCGGSVLYIGRSNGYYLYNQNINVSCDSVVKILNGDSLFVNILPLIAEEKVSANIYNNSGINFSDSVNNIYWSGVILNTGLTSTLLDSIKACVKSFDTTGNNLKVFGTRSQMLCLAGNVNVVKVYDLQKEGPPTMDNSRSQTIVNTLHGQNLDLLAVPPDTSWNSNAMFTGKGITISVWYVKVVV